MWQNVNKTGPLVGGTDLINYSELYHPHSLHNTVTGAVQPMQVPSEVDEAAQKFTLVQQGFYSAKTMASSGAYKAQVEGTLNRNDPRALDNPDMFVQKNFMARQINPDLLKEIEASQR